MSSRKSLEQPQNHQDPYPLLGNLPQIAQQWTKQPKQDDTIYDLNIILLFLFKGCEERFCDLCPETLRWAEKDEINILYYKKHTCTLLKYNRLIHDWRNDLKKQNSTYIFC